MQHKKDPRISLVFTDLYGMNTYPINGLDKFEKSGYSGLLVKIANKITISVADFAKLPILQVLQKKKGHSVIFKKIINRESSIVFRSLSKKN